MKDRFEQDLKPGDLCIIAYSPGIYPAIFKGTSKTGKTSYIKLLNSVLIENLITKETYMRSSSWTVMFRVKIES